jgi:hypothetical protein
MYRGARQDAKRARKAEGRDSGVTGPEIGQGRPRMTTPPDLGPSDTTAWVGIGFYEAGATAAPCGMLPMTTRPVCCAGIPRD